MERPPNRIPSRIFELCIGQSCASLDFPQLFSMAHIRLQLCSLTLAILSSAVFAEEPGYFLLPEAPRGELTKFLSSPLLDRSVLSDLASRAEFQARKTLGERREIVLSAVCSAGPEQSALRQEKLAQVRREHAAYRTRLQAVEDHTMRRIEKEIEPALREQAAALRRTAFQMQGERNALVRRSWEELLAGADCKPAPLFSEKLFMPYYLALFQYQSIFPPERRFGSLLLLKDGR